MKLAEVPPLWQEAAQLWSRHALVGSDQEPLLLPGLHVVLLLMDSLITVDNLSYRGISRHGGCFCLLVRARTGALLSEKAVGSAPPVDAAPLADARAPLSAPRSDMSLSPQPSCAAGSWEWGYRGRMVFPQPGSSHQLVRDFFFLVLAVTGFQPTQQRSFPRKLDQGKCRVYLRLLCVCVVSVLSQTRSSFPARKGTSQGQSEQWGSKACFV